MKSINPFDPTQVQSHPQLSDEELELKLEQSWKAFEIYRKSSFEERSGLMLQMSQLLEEKSRELAETITREMGKPLREAEAEVRKCAWVCEFYAEKAADFLSDRIVKTEARESRVIFEALGPLLAVMPWNFPFWQVFRFAAPALMAGNTVLLKHASNVQSCAQSMSALFAEAGFVKGAFQNLAIGSGRVAQVIASKYVKAVTLTGSTKAGKAVAAIAGQHLKKCVLELGGSNAFVVLKDARLESALEIAIPARLQNGGQSCIAAKRFLLEEPVAGTFSEGLKKAVTGMVVGDPMDEHTQVGPLSSVQQALEVERQVEASIRQGATLLLGGKRDGAFYLPTILSDVKPGMPVFDEEVFGPVFSLTGVRSPGHALELSNRSAFGLGMQVFTASEASAEIFIRGAREGAVFVNGMVRSDPRLPFGGVKESGYGRELSEEGIKEFVNIKTVWID